MLTENHRPYSYIRDNRPISFSGEGENGNDYGVIADFKMVPCDSYADFLLIMSKIRANVILRGLRSALDFEYNFSSRS